MRFQHLPRNGQAHAAATLFPREQRLENAIADAAPDAGAVVGKVQLAAVKSEAARAAANFPASERSNGYWDPSDRESSTW